MASRLSGRSRWLTQLVGLAPKQGMVAGILRLIASGGRFVLAIGLARHLGVAQLSEVGAVQSVVVIGSKVLGFGMGVVTGRRLVTADQAEIPVLVRRQVRLLLRQYAGLAVLAPLAFTLLAPSLSMVIFWSALILVPTHLAVELYHGLIFRRHVATANFVLAMVNGLWAWPAVALAAAVAAARSVETVYICWLAGSLLAASAALQASGAFVPADPGAVDRRPPPTMDRACLVVYVGQLALFAMLFGDRLVLSLILPSEQVGQFVLFWSFGYGVQTITQGFVASSLAAPLARAEQGADRQAFRRLLLLALASTAFTAGCGLTIVFVLWAAFGETMLGAAARLPSLHLVCLVAGFWLRSLADVLHIAHVVRHADRELAACYVWAAAPALLLAGLAGQELGAAGAYLAVLGSSLLTLALLARSLRPVWRCR